jgi:hypothetical protein
MKIVWNRHPDPKNEFNPLQAWGDGLVILLGVAALAILAALMSLPILLAMWLVEDTLGFDLPPVPGSVGWLLLFVLGPMAVGAAGAIPSQTRSSNPLP